MIADELARKVMRAATDLALRLNSPPWQIRERPVLLANANTLVKVGWTDGEYYMGLRVKLDPGAPPDTIYVTDLRTLNHEVIRV